MVSHYDPERRRGYTALPKATPQILSTSACNVDAMHRICSCCGELDRPGVPHPAFHSIFKVHGLSAGRNTLPSDNVLLPGEITR